MNDGWMDESLNSLDNGEKEKRRRVRGIWVIKINRSAKTTGIIAIIAGKVLLIQKQTNYDLCL